MKRETKALLSNVAQGVVGALLLYILTVMVFSL